MKKIKKKKSSPTASLPAFLVGWTHGDVPPAGYLSAWFNQEYGGPLQIRFLSSSSSKDFEACHTVWVGLVKTGTLPETVQRLSGQLEWEHSEVIQILSRSRGNLDRQNETLHLARLARGMTLLTEGTAYDVSTGVYLNPSDWLDQSLTEFHIQDHIQILARDLLEKTQLWLHTRGLRKFALDDLEMFLPFGLPYGPSQDLLRGMVRHLINTGKDMKVGEKVFLEEMGETLEVIRHRTDSTYGAPLAFREVRTS